MKYRAIDYLIDVPNKILALLCVMDLLRYVFSVAGMGAESVNLLHSPRDLLERSGCLCIKLVNRAIAALSLWSSCPFL